MERKFTWKANFDEQSRAYDLEDIIDDRQLRNKAWRCQKALDQGAEGSCVGFGWAHNLACWPDEKNFFEADAQAIYDRAKRLDIWPGQNYEGTSVLAGAKAAKEMGYISTYRWAFDTTDALLALSNIGPVVIGVNWYEGMMGPDGNGYLHKTGDVVGGHCVCVRGIVVGAEVVLVHNSWGRRWGHTNYGPSTAFLTFEDFDALLAEDGECCIPTEA